MIRKPHSLATVQITYLRTALYLGNLDLQSTSRICVGTSPQRPLQLLGPSSNELSRAAGKGMKPAYLFIQQAFRRTLEARTVFPFHWPAHKHRQKNELLSSSSILVQRSLSQLEAGRSFSGCFPWTSHTAKAGYLR